MSKRKYLFEKLGLSTFEIKLKNGNTYTNYPLRGDNLATAESVKEFLIEHDSYFLTLGNSRTIEIRRDDIKEIL